MSIYIFLVARFTQLPVEAFFAVAESKTILNPTDLAP